MADRDSVDDVAAVGSLITGPPADTYGRGSANGWARCANVRKWLSRGGFQCAVHRVGKRARQGNQPADWPRRLAARACAAVQTARRCVEICTNSGAAKILTWVARN